jgi:creatinine amidohydrolase
VIIVNGHGGNESLLPYFAQTQLEKQHDYVVYVFGLPGPPPNEPAKKTKIDMHAGEGETSNLLITHPDLVHLDRANKESGADQARLKLNDYLYTAIWWYARFPNHYSGDGSAASRELGAVDVKWWIDQIVESIKSVKADDTSLKLQNEFFEKAKHPLDTRPSN